MAVDANIVRGGQRYPVLTAEERARAFVGAERHTKLVLILRKALPVAAVLVLASYFISSRLSVSLGVGDLTASIDGIQVANGNLRMTNPKLEGADKKKGKYVIGAEYADQDMKSPNIIKLHAIRAELSSADGGWSRMDAARGVFNSKTERLVMRDKIAVATSSGITGALRRASLDTKNQALRSHQPVSFDLPGGSVRANALTFLSGKSTLTFRGKVRVHIVKQKREMDEAPTAVPPLPDAASAAQSGSTGAMPVEAQ